MVSRTPRHSSQPRPSMSHKSSSIDAWDRNGASHQPRRAQSSMRYSSNGRNSSRGRPGSTRNGQMQQQQPRPSNLRPRAISAGRLREQSQRNTDDPTDVARQILELREQRESSQRNKRSSMNPPGGHKRPPSSIPSHITTQGSGSPKALALMAVPSSMSQEEMEAEERLRRAESKIGNMLEDLEELKFFQEIEMESPGPTTPRTPKRTASNSNKKANGPPTTIRAASPARGRRLPPPPSNKKVGGLETYKPMSPRSIARLDRNSLELECQTIVRKLQILEQELFSHQATIEMYEITLQEHDNDKAKVNQLEGELQKVSAELRKQLYNITKGKEALVKDYEDRLKNNLQKLHRTQEKADAYQVELQTAQGAAQQLEGEVQKYRSLAAKEKAKVDGMLSNEETLQSQLNEARGLNATLVKKVEKKREELTELKENLEKAATEMEETTRASEKREDAHESQVAHLEQQLHAFKDQCTKLEQKCAEQTDKAVAKETELNEISTKQSDYENTIREMEDEIEFLRKEVEIKFAEGKKAVKAQERSNAQKLVAERANASREYEQRIKTMQEKLKHQTDRHHKEIEETRIRNEKNLEAMKDQLREEIRAKEGDKVARLESKLASMKRSFDEERLNLTTRLQDAQQKARSNADEFQQQDLMRQQELDHLHGRLNSYFNDFTEKDNEITRLKERLDESTKIREELESIQKKQAKEITKHLDLIEAERTKFFENETKMDDEIQAMKAAKSKVEDEMEAEIQELRDEVNIGRKNFSELKALLKEKEETLDAVQNAFEECKQDLFAESARAAELEDEVRLKVTQVEEELRSRDEAIREKESKIGILSKQLDVAALTSSKEGDEKQIEIDSLKKKLEDATGRLEASIAASKTQESQIREMRYETDKLKQSLSNMSDLEDDLRDMKRSLTLAESDKRKREEELFEIRADYESTQSKVDEVEQKYANAKEEYRRRLESKEELIERCEKTIEDLELSLDRERCENKDLKSTFRDQKMEARRKEADLMSLRKDYEELSEVLEENLHSSAKKDEVDLMLKKKEAELRQTVDKYNRQFAEMERQIMESTTSNEELQAKNETLESSLKKIKAEKMKIYKELTKLQREHEFVTGELEEMREEQQNTLRGMTADIGKKDSHLREAVQRYTRTIANLETKLEEETQSKLELEDRLASARSELEDKQKQVQEMVQRHTKATAALESKFAKTSADNDHLHTELELAKRGLSKKESELSTALTVYKDEMATLESVKQEHNQFRDLSQATRNELQQREQQITKMRQEIDELKKKLKNRTVEYKEMKLTCERTESELKQRKEQVNELVTKYTDRIADLESQLEAHSDAMTSSDGKVETVQAQLERKDEKIRELLKSAAEMEAKLEAANRTKESAKVKAESASKDLEERESKLRMFEVEKIELETKVHTLARSKDEARAKMSELSSKLERKEREVREVSDKYKIYVMELESKLDQDTETKHFLQSEIDRLRGNLDSANDVSMEASDLRQKVHALEISVESANENTESLRRNLEEASKSRKSIEAALTKANEEKAEVIAALEGVINEVQNREDEIESLSELLQQRDEELQHAKIIATKALASAKDIQKRYKDKSEGRHSDLMGRMNDVSENIDRLTSKNEALQRHISTLERDLRDRNLECKRLKDQLRSIDAKNMRDNNMKDDISAMSTQSTEFSNFSNRTPDVPEDEDRQLQPDPMITMASQSFSPRTNGSQSDDGFSEGEVNFPSINTEYSKDSVDDSLNDNSKWQDFDGDSRSGFESVSSEQQSTISRRSVERDALRKYVRQRYSSRGQRS